MDSPNIPEIGRQLMLEVSMEGNMGAAHSSEYFQRICVLCLFVQKMSAELISASGNNASLQGTTVGGSKPLHRFMKGQPKSVGVRH